MPNLRQPWRAPRSGGRILTALAVVTSLVVASAIVLATTSRQTPLAARGTPLPLPSTPSPTAPAATPSPPAAAPAYGLPPATTLTSAGSNEVVALTSAAAAISSQGMAWVQIPVPSGASGLVVDHADADIFAAGGAKVQTTSDGGKHWAATAAEPAATGPFVPLLISPWDSRVLFVSHQSQVAVTTDGGSTWQNVAVPPAGQPVMTSGNTAGTFFVGTGSSTYQLTDNGAHVNTRPQLPGGVTATELSVGRYLLLAYCSDRHLFILKGTRWTPAPIAAAGPLAVDGTDLWAAVTPSGGTTTPAIEESSDGGVTWQARPGLPAGEAVVSLALSGDGHTVYALTNIGNVYEAQKGIWYLLSTDLQLASPPA